MNLFDNMEFNLFDIPESLPEIPIPNPPNPPKKINLNDVKNPRREDQLRRIREQIEKNKEKSSS